MSFAWEGRGKAQSGLGRVFSAQAGGLANSPACWPTGPRAAGSVFRGFSVISTRSLRQGPSDPDAAPAMSLGGEAI